MRNSRERRFWTLRLLPVLTAGAFVALAGGVLAAEMGGGMANAPSVRIVSPATGATVTTTGISVRLAIKNFNLECNRAGQPGQIGRGHIHVMIDGMGMQTMTNVECSDTFTISGQGIRRGTHELIVMLASDDHLPGSMPAMVKFKYEPAALVALPAAAAGMSSLVIVSPNNGASVGRTFDLKVAVRNFRNSCALEGKPDVRGWGHLHVFVTQAGVTDRPAHDMMMPASMGKMMPETGMIGMPCTTTIPVDLSAWRSGPAKITVMLANNDHMPTMGAAPATINVIVR
jgi:hypothetical protein